MKRLITILTLLVISLGAFAQADSLARTMNGFYKWNGEQFYTDTIWADTSMFDVSTGNVQLALDTAGGSSTGYYKLTTTAGGSGGGNIKGSGTANQGAFFISSDSVISTNLIQVDTTNSIISVGSGITPSPFRVRSQDGGDGAQFNNVQIKQTANVSIINTDTNTENLRFTIQGDERLSLDTNLTVFNDTDGSPKDVMIKSSTDTTAYVDVNNGRVSINGNPNDYSDATFTIKPSGSDTLFRFIDPPTGTGANTPTFNNSPYGGNIRWLFIKLVISGVEVNGVIPIVFE